MIKKSMNLRLIRTRIALNQTIKKILDVNRNRKQLSYTDDPVKHEETLNRELRVLNKMAKQQAQLVQHYESVLSSPDTWPSQPFPLSR